MLTNQNYMDLIGFGKVNKWIFLQLIGLFVQEFNFVNQQSFAVLLFFESLLILQSILISKTHQWVPISVHKVFFKIFIHSEFVVVITSHNSWFLPLCLVWYWIKQIHKKFTSRNGRSWCKWIRIVPAFIHGHYHHFG